MYIMQSEREALQRMVNSFANEYGLSVSTRDFNGTHWIFCIYAADMRINPQGFTVIWDKVENIYKSFKAIEDAVLRENPSIAAVRSGKMLAQGFIDGVKGNKLAVKNVMFKPPATIVFWSDGSKTVVKTQKDDKYDPEKGLAMAISKRFLGNSGKYYNVFSKWLEKAPNPYCGFVFQPPVYAVEKVSEDGKIHTEFARRFLGKWKKQESQN